MIDLFVDCLNLKACETVGEKRPSGKALSGFPTPHGIHMFYSACCNALKKANLEQKMPRILAVQRFENKRHH